MAKKQDNSKTQVVKKEIRQKVIVEQGNDKIPFKVLYTEFVPSAERAKERVIELKNEYKDTEGLSVSYFSV